MFRLRLSTQFVTTGGSLNVYNDDRLAYSLKDDSEITVML